MADRPSTKEWIGWLLGLGSLLVLAASSYNRVPRENKAISAEIGQTMAAEAIKLLKPGAKVTLIARDTEAFPQMAMRTAVEAIEAGLRDAGKEIRSVELVQLDPIRPAEVPSGDFYELLRRAPEGDVIVSLLGPPVLLPEQRQKLGAPRARVVALCTGSAAQSVSLEELMRAGLLHAAILNKPGAAAGRSFEQLYAVVHP